MAHVACESKPRSVVRSSIPRKIDGHGVSVDRPQGSCGVCDIPEVLRGGTE